MTLNSKTCSAVILLRNAALLSGAGADLLIDGGKIAKIAPAGSLPIPQFGEVMNCDGKVVLPTFVNAHTHAAMTLMRGICEDRVLESWLHGIWEVEDRMDQDFVYIGTRIAALEMVRTGTTAFNDQYWYANHAQQAAADAGIRATVGRVVLDNFDAKEAAMLRETCERMYEESRSWGPLSAFAANIHSVYTVSEEMIRWTTEFARKRGLRIHVHVAETATEVENCRKAHGGLSPVEYLDALGVLGPDVIAAHCLHLSDHDVELLGSRGVSCVHNINSNLKLASGYRFRFRELKEAGANVCLGTDGCASSNNLDLLEAMKTAALVQKAWRGDPTAMPLEDVFACATVNGAKALGLDSGVVEEGRSADLMVVDTDSTYFLSDAPFLANFIYSAHSDCIDSVLCNGEFLMRGRRIPGEKALLERARKALATIRP